MGRIWRVEVELDLLASELGLKIRVKSSKTFLKFFLSPSEVGTLVTEDLMGPSTSSHETPQSH